MWRWLETYLDRRADLILTSTEHARADLIRRVGIAPERINVLPDTVDPEQFRPPRPGDASCLKALATRWGLDLHRPIVAYLGLLAPYQGIDTLLEAFRWLQVWWGTSPRPFLLLMGFPFVEEYRQKVHALGLTDDVLLTGPIPYDDAPHYLRLARVAVAPKRPVSEGAGKLLPYMATALPVVATDTPAHRAYLGEDAYYAPPDDAQALARALLTALQDPGAVERGQRLRRRVIEGYTWAHAVERIEAAWKSLL